ncbi:Fumitremorgin C synthase [Leucoagaricus sp. SymC.cos]|nr:Fumitremorgin C synthase [Leucoagaricus sp. SymC.cos]
MTFFFLLPTTTITVAFLLAGFIIVLRVQEHRLRLRAAMPPGPPYCWFGLGDNRYHVPDEQAWRIYAQWHHKHRSSIVSAVLGGTSIILLGSIKAATDILEKRGSVYSSRPKNVIGGEILSGYMRGVGMPYGTKWRNWRSLMHAGLSIEHSKSYMPLQLLESKIFLKDMMTEKDHRMYSLHIRSGEILSGYMRGVGMPYGTKWRNWRSLMHAGLSIEHSKSYMPLQLLESKIFLRDMMTEKDHRMYSLHIRRFALSIVTSVAYGQRIQTLQDQIVLENVEIDELSSEDFSQKQRLSSEPDYQNHITGRFSFDYQWVMFTSVRATNQRSQKKKFLQWFRWTPEKMRLRDTSIYLKLLNSVRQRMDNGTAMPCVATCGLERQQDWELSDIELAYACSAPWQAGGSSVCCLLDDSVQAPADPYPQTTALIEMFIMAMLLFPPVMSAAQSEIDAVIGRDRQPDYDDLHQLPYTEAVVKEVQRWRPILPLAVAHCNIYPDEYEGAFIPSGSTVYANVFAMAQDPEIFPDPDRFLPERFLGPNAVPTFTAGFGFGRRQCPGMHIATNSLFILISKILWAFDIRPCLDPSTGLPTLPNPNDLEGDFLVRPKNLAYMLSLRGEPEATKELIRLEAERAENEALTWTV